MAKIVAMVTTVAEQVGGGAPIIIAKDRTGLERTAFLLEKMLDCAAHELAENLFIIVDHRPVKG